MLSTNSTCNGPTSGLPIHSILVSRDTRRTRVACQRTKAKAERRHWSSCSHTNDVWIATRFACSEDSTFVGSHVGCTGCQKELIRTRLLVVPQGPGSLLVVGLLVGEAGFGGLLGGPIGGEAGVGGLVGTDAGGVLVGEAGAGRLETTSRWYISDLSRRARAERRRSPDSTSPT